MKQSLKKLKSLMAVLITLYFDLRLSGYNVHEFDIFNYILKLNGYSVTRVLSGSVT